MSYIFTKSTDEYHEEKVDSQLIYAIWKQGIARGGSNTELEVRTAFVGEGAKIEITVKGTKSKKIMSFDDLIFGNRYTCAVPMPPDLEIDEDVFFEVKLSKQKLKGKSNPIPAYPMPEIISMSWDREVARRGDTVQLNAEFDRVQENCNVKVRIFEYDSDGVHDPIVTIPTTLKGKKLELMWEYEYHEDVDEIPTQEELEKYGGQYNPPEYFFVVDIDGAMCGDEQESGILKFKDEIEIIIQQSDGSPMPEMKVKIKLSNGDELEEVTDENGIILLEDQDPGSYTYELVEE